VNGLESLPQFTSEFPSVAATNPPGWKKMSGGAADEDVRSCCSCCLSGKTDAYDLPSKKYSCCSCCSYKLCQVSWEERAESVMLSLRVIQVPCCCFNAVSCVAKKIAIYFL